MSLPPDTGGRDRHFDGRVYLMRKVFSARFHTTARATALYATVQATISRVNTLVGCWIWRHIHQTK